MSPSGNPPQDDTPRQTRRINVENPQTAQIIEFVDSQDPNSRSAIQRHTAYHSAAQRRDTRSRLLRRSSQTRYLEWTRRSRADPEVAISSASSTSSVSISPAPSLPERSEQPTRASSNEGVPLSNLDPARDSTNETTQTARETAQAADEAVLSFLTSTFCTHFESRAMLDSALAFIQEHESSRYILLAYAYSIRRMRLAAEGNTRDQLEAQANLGRGTNSLWNRLQVQGEASSDANVQTVLLLVAYAADFGQVTEVQLHTDALRTMVDQRGGISGFSHNPALHHQLLAIEGSRRYHLTLDCVTSCPDQRRFPNGLRLSHSRQPG